jgi:hypothetical protein
MKILEEKGVKKYLEKRGIIKQYRKVKKNFEEGNYQQILLKKRQPKQFGEFQFRITDKYRAFGYFKEQDIFIVTEISDHQ